MTFSSNRLIAIGDVNNISPFNTDVPDSSIEVKVSLTVPTGGGVIPSVVSAGATIPSKFEPTDLKKFSRIKVEVKIENITKQNLDAVMDTIKAEVVGKATNLLDMPEAV